MATPPSNHHHHPPPPSPPPSPESHRSLPMFLPVIILFFFLIGFFSIYLFHDLLNYLTATWPLFRRRAGAHPRPSGDGGPHALDPAILASFPTFPYSAMRGLREGMCGLECAVCLSEFAGDDVIRLLMVCCHAFHRSCIDELLASHATCPICRSDLEGPSDEAAVRAVEEAVGGGGDSYRISVDGEEEGGDGHVARIRKGDSMVHVGGRVEEDERYTLRLPGGAEERTASLARTVSR